MFKRFRTMLPAVVSLAVMAPAFSPRDALAKGKASHVVVMVWDGLRRDFVSPQYTPNLYQLATEGVFFKKHHPVFLSSTEVNGAAIATGTHPGTSGIIANSDYRPEINLLGPLATEGVELARRSDAVTGGNYLSVPTLAEILQEEGIRTITAGTKPVVFLHDRDKKKASTAGKESVLLYEGKTLPRKAVEACTKVNDNKAFPGRGKDGDNWTTKAVLNGLWAKGAPRYTLLWLSEPDNSQHADGIGHSNVVAALENNDRLLGEVLKSLDEKGLKKDTDILIISDHGFSTTLKGPDLVAILKRAKFTATRKHEDPEKGDILVVGLGGASCFYVYEQDETTIRKLVEFLQTADFTGAVFSRLPIEGTFPLDLVKLNPTNVTPDVVVSFRWTAEANEHGAPGQVIADGGARGKGTHGSLGIYDMLNTAVAWGPDFKKGWVSDIPSGSIDIAPTILHLLGIDHNRFTFKFQGLDARLSGVEGARVIRDILA